MKSYVFIIDIYFLLKFTDCFVIFKIKFFIYLEFVIVKKLIKDFIIYLYSFKTLFHQKNKFKSLI